MTNDLPLRLISAITKERPKVHEVCTLISSSNGSISGQHGVVLLLLMMLHQLKLDDEFSATGVLEIGSLEEIAIRQNASVRTIRRKLKELERNGWLEINNKSMEQGARVSLAPLKQRVSELRGAARKTLSDEEFERGLQMLDRH